MATNDAAIPYRVGVLERRIEAHRQDIDDKASKEDFDKISEEIASLRKTLIGLMVTIAVASIVFALGVLQFVLTSAS